MIDFFQTEYGVSLIGTIENLSPGKHAIAIHKGNDCSNPGPHFNPTKADHGPLHSRVRRVGGLGNIAALEADGPTSVNVLDSVISLNPNNAHNVLGRTLVIYSGEDDFGTKDTEKSRQNGSAGKIIACGTIQPVAVSKTLRTY